MKTIKLHYYNEKKILEGILKVYEESPNDEEMVLIELTVDNNTISFQDETFFQAFQALRQYLEKKYIQIMCNGAAINVYPSPMQLSMGVGRFAYKLTTGKPAKTEDIVDIFEYDRDLKFVGIDEQFNYYISWLKSINFLE